MYFRTIHCFYGGHFEIGYIMNIIRKCTNVHMIKTRMTALAVKTFRSLENTQYFKELMLKHEIVQKRSGCNTILDQLLAAIQADA